jgi:hypothetical protein
MIAPGRAQHPMGAGEARASVLWNPGMKILREPVDMLSNPIGRTEHLLETRPLELGECPHGTKGAVGHSEGFLRAEPPATEASGRRGE